MFTLETINRNDLENHREDFFLTNIERCSTLGTIIFGQIGEKFPLKRELLFCKKLKNDLAADLTNFLYNIYVLKSHMKQTSSVFMSKIYMILSSLELSGQLNI